MSFSCPLDISDKTWDLLKAILPGQKGQWGGLAYDNRRFINAVIWVLYHAASWRSLPSRYGGWNTVYQRFRRWRSQGLWEDVLGVLIDLPEYQWIFTGSEGAVSAYGERIKSGSKNRPVWPWLRMVCKSEYLLKTIPLRVNRMSHQT